MSATQKIKTFVKTNKVPLIIIGTGIAFAAASFVFVKNANIASNIAKAVADDSVWFEEKDGMFIIHDASVTPNPNIV